MIIQDKYLLGTIREITNYIANEYYKDYEFKDFDFVESKYTYEEIEQDCELQLFLSKEIKRAEDMRSYWYGIKKIYTGFNSPMLILAGDCYGGGCFKSVQVDPDGDNLSDILCDLIRIILISNDEIVDEDDLYIVQIK